MFPTPDNLEASWYELAYFAERAGVSIEHICATVEAATQVARESTSAHKGGQYQSDLPYESDLDAVIHTLLDDDFDLEIKDITWEESKHPRDEQGRFTNGGAHSALGNADANITYAEIIHPSEYLQPTKVLTAKEARDELERLNKKLASRYKHLTDRLENATKHLDWLDTQQASTPAEQAKLNAQRKQAGKYAQQIRHRIEATQLRDLPKLRAVLYTTDPVGINVRFDSLPLHENIMVPITSQYQKDAALSGSEEVRRLVSKKLDIGDIHFERETIQRLRSKFAAKYRIKLTDDAGTRVVIHEFGHVLEKMNPTVGQKARDFLEQRTKGEPLLNLHDVDKTYSKLERYRADRFINPYMGKIYDNGSTEILSMGLEYFYSDPLRLATEDPDYFDFVYNTLRGL